jgi:APA family basic amino acid/polyamine antiporter
METLGGSASPLDLVFEDAPESVRLGFNLIAAFATVNGVLIQMIMASRVIYGMASNKLIDQRLAYLHPATRTPIVATILVVLIILCLALLFPIDRLAALTSQVALATFFLVNLSLAAMKFRPGTPKAGFTVPVWCPVIGATFCLLLILAPLFLR